MKREEVKSIEDIVKYIEGFKYALVKQGRCSGSGYIAVRRNSREIFAFYEDGFGKYPHHKSTEEVLDYIDRRMAETEKENEEGYIDEKLKKPTIEETPIKAPSYYEFEINGQKADVNDLLIALSKKLEGKCSGYQFGCLANAIEYLYRCFLKNQLQSDLEKAKNNIDFILKNINNK